MNSLGFSEIETFVLSMPLIGVLTATFRSPLYTLSKKRIYMKHSNGIPVICIFQQNVALYTVCNVIRMPIFFKDATIKVKFMQTKQRNQQFDSLDGTFIVICALFTFSESGYSTIQGSSKKHLLQAISYSLRTPQD